MDWIEILAAAACAAVIALFALAYYFSSMVIHIRTHSNDVIINYELNGGRISKEEFDALRKEEVTIPSPHGYRLNAWWIPAEGGENVRTVVFAHGVTSSLYGMSKYTGMFRRRGFNVLVYDQRRHGASGGKTTTYGFYEKWDLKACVDWVFERHQGRSPVVGVFGESMGAATALQHAAIDDRVAFYVADCPYSDLKEQLAFRLKEQFKLPKFPLLQLTSLWCRIRSGFFFHQVSPIRDVARSRAPILYVHGDKDDFVPSRMTLELHKATAGPKELYLAEEAGHAEAYLRHKDDYERVLDRFLADVARA
ncbi:alpha/beta hydrolase [Paenibacillus thermotolerans]|uniref:alpha/beta hydrolase n=1 Tax=Paenibacillus thermotolerans TaxID=3027807 RepID=UPI00236801FB|nr:MULTISPECIES: alpha/beta hydrolase [unclassified Paenibacillus]